MTTFYWNNELVFELIRMFEEKPELWDISSEHYRDKDKRQESWSEIASAMDTDVSTVERKMRMLMSQYRRELFTKRNSRWFAFHRLSFLKSRQLAVSHKIRKRPPCFVSVNQDRGEQSSKPNQQGDALRIERPVVVVKDRIIPKQRDHKSQEKDEYTTYGELVAMKLKKIGSSYARSTAQYHINNILYKAEIGEYDTHPRQNKSFTSKEHFRAASSSAHHDSNYDVQSQRSSSTKSMDYNMKFEEIENEDSDEKLL